MKRKIFSIALILVILYMLSSCNYMREFSNYNIGQVFIENRDECIYKLNDNFVLDHMYGEDDIIYKLRFPLGDDIFENAEEYYRGRIISCYCNNQYIILSLDENFILIDCENKNNQILYNSISDINIDLSKFEVVNLYTN